MERGFLYGSVPPYSSISKGTTYQQNLPTTERRRTEGSGQILQSSSIRPMASCAADLASVHGIALVKQPQYRGISTEYPVSFPGENCRIENSVHNDLIYCIIYVFYVFVKRGVNRPPSDLRSRWAAYFCVSQQIFFVAVHPASVLRSGAGAVGGFSSGGVDVGRPSR